MAYATFLETNVWSNFSIEDLYHFFWERIDLKQFIEACEGNEISNRIKVMISIRRMLGQWSVITLLWDVIFMLVHPLFEALEGLPHINPWAYRARNTINQFRIFHFRSGFLYMRKEPFCMHHIFIIRLKTYWKFKTNALWRVYIWRRSCSLSQANPTFNKENFDYLINV